ncbi:MULTISPECIES: 50S ribosomal protein L24 [unclassified Pseudoclavibacter]|uniref:50S ribosomal protein L24 n=1 Tax=unclassified Pseudoclavibacter TaxID=2615177 RepID=UPI0013011961|nr:MULTISPECIES: 50S ribosomal protein L24 [unclassified Pseudoclavibacter]KAB1644363.1 50S ribosomal protein L24 [Pseudoclavibacter sp. CFCC 14310]KAB1658936.1 50S ribosomal protein L24 [Pseudoclavibacter sp. CFCC 11306]KAB1661030.1 50S ribosomal protein L24 [Pseudoclavibacter sp. CFCC 13796]KAB1664135.1 50S ribosomal protein L24 [Pseudoclavibacter sp. CFCC 13611]
MAKIRKGDLVEVISGASQDRGGDRGKQGTVLRVIPETDRVVVEGVNIVKRHVRAGVNGEQGGIKEFEAPIHVSNVAIVDPETKKPTRVGFRVEEVETNGVKRTVRVRYAKKSGKDI